jgi:hypothetical protein
MDCRSLQETRRYQIQKFLLPGGRDSSRRRHNPKLQNKNFGNLDGGFFEIEMLLWISIILLILVGYFSIHKVYRNEHQLVQEEFTNEWNKLNTKRRN